MNYKKLILDLLLDKYEYSRHYTGDARINRRIAIIFNKRSLPQYDIENTEEKSEIHYALKSLEDKGIISVQWVKFERGNIVDRVYLNVDNVDKAYSEIGRKPKKDIVSDVLENLEMLKNTLKTDWILRFIEDQIGEIEKKKALTKYIPEDEYIFSLLINSLKGMEYKGDEEMLERVFSKRYLGSSKLFETKIRSRFCTILREYCLEGDAEDEEVLQEIGIIKTAEELLFFGPLIIKLMGQSIDFGSFYFGASMNTGMIKNFEVLALNVKRVITIENKANYLEYIKRENLEETLVVYLGGFYSPVKRVFLQKVYNYIKENGIEVSFYHWGDIDLGGFNIFMQLKSRIIDKLCPLYMDMETLKMHSESGEKFEKAYAKKLEKLLQDKRYGIFHEVIGEMLESGIRLEQEALL